MRYVLLFLLIVSLVMGFFFADHFPGLLARFPWLQELNRTVREWLNTDTDNGSSPRFSERELKETDQILQKETSAMRPTTEPDLPEYHD
jgi:hypothetical protein